MSDVTQILNAIDAGDPRAAAADCKRLPDRGRVRPGGVLVAFDGASS
jgi:hypothetical protein